MKEKFFVIGLTVLFCFSYLAFAQEQEAGQYERKSVSYINALWLLDPTARALKPDQVGYILEKVKQGISMSRFDYNPLPEPMLIKFMQRANMQPSLTIDDVAMLMEEELVPQIIKILEAEREMRAANLLTEQQKNSFITDKAKELGVTGEQMENIMNSAYLYLPVISHFLLEKTGKEEENQTWKCTARMGILWYSLSTKEDIPKVRLRVKNMTTTFGMARKKNLLGSSTYTIDGKTVRAREYAFRSMVRSGVKNLVVATQEIPEFSLSGQILETSGLSVGFDLGKNEGIKVDDRYLVMEQVENKSGNIHEEKTGWILTSFVADTNSKEGYKSKAKIIGGSPSIGNVLREYPRLPIDIRFGYKMFPVKADYKGSGNNINQSINDSIKVKLPANGFEILALYNIGRVIRVSQLFAGFGYGTGFGSVAGNVNTFDPIEGLTVTTFEVPLLKRFYLRRIAMDMEASLTIQQCDFDLRSTGSIKRSIANSTLGFSAGGGLGYALSPSLLLNVTGLFQMNGKSKEWEIRRDGEKSAIETNSSGFTFKGQAPLDHSGVSLRAGLTWSPPSLPFDPWEMFKGMTGL